MALENFNALSGATLVWVYIMMFSFASSVDLKQFMTNLKKPKGVIIGIICQYIYLPFLAFILASIFQHQLLPEQSVALIIMGTMPGGTMSNFFCFCFGADLTLSITMTTASSLSSFIFITINGLIYIPIIAAGTNLKIDYMSLILSVSVLICGVISGLYLSHRDKNGSKCAKYSKIYMNIFVIITFIIVCIFVIVFGFVFAKYPIYKLPFGVIAAPLILAILAWFGAFTFAFIFKLKRNSQVSVAIECANQNAGFATAILILTLGDEGTNIETVLAIPMLYCAFNYSVCMMMGFTAKRIGYIVVDEEDKAMSFSKLFDEWKARKQRYDVGDDDDSLQDNINTAEPQTLECEMETHIAHKDAVVV